MFDHSVRDQVRKLVNQPTTVTHTTQGRAGHKVECICKQQTDIFFWFEGCIIARELHKDWRRGEDTPLLLSSSPSLPPKLAVLWMTNSITPSPYHLLPKNWLYDDGWLIPSRGQSLPPPIIFPLKLASHTSITCKTQFVFKVNNSAQKFDQLLVHIVRHTLRNSEPQVI